jgi:YfiH family protein
MHWELPTGVHAVCTTRVGGMSTAPFDGFNLAEHVGDDPQAVVKNRELLHSQLDGARPVFLSQVHGVKVVELAATTPDGIQADACITLDKHVACTVMVADCLPVLFTDDAGRVVAAAHAGWRGLAAGVIEHTVQALCTQGHVAPAQMKVWLGPCIGPDAFEVGEDVCAAFSRGTASQSAQAQRYFKPHPVHPGKWLADLAGLARLRLQTLGIASVAGNNSTPDWCTVTQHSRLFSFRRDGLTGRFALCIWRS